MTRTKRPQALQPGKRLTINSLEHEIDRRLYRVLKIVKDRSKDSKVLVFDPTLSPKNRTTNVRTLLKIEKGIFKGKYREKLWLFIKHVNEAFEYIITTNSKLCKTYKMALEFKKVIESQMDEIMKELGYCCGYWYDQKARLVECSGKEGCIVPEEQTYFRYNEWTYCYKCFRAIPGNLIKSESKTVHKNEFRMYYFEKSHPEPFVRCEICGLKFHQVCVMHSRFSLELFYCDNCREQSGIKKIPIRASCLPKTECDEFINDFLKNQNVNHNDGLTIRLLSEAEQEMEVQEKFRKFRAGPDKIVYRNCTLFTFFDTGADTDICFFAVYFQLFGDRCQNSNRNSAYISYIDSVNFLPEHRTLIYRLILLGLFAFLKSKGYEKIYLWSCPPKNKQDYIFYAKPLKMKMPLPTRLANWYRELLALGIDLNVIQSYTGIQNEAKDIDCLPFMEGDLWVTRLDEAIVAVQEERVKLFKDYKKLKEKLELEKQRLDVSKVSEVKQNIQQWRLQLKKHQPINKIWELMEIEIKGCNRQYFVIHLESTGNVENESFAANQLINSSEWLNDRHLFMDFFWGNCLEFSTERLAQYSTLVMLRKIFGECSICAMCKTQKGSITIQLLCRQCDRIYKQQLVGEVTEFKEEEEETAEDKVHQKETDVELTLGKPPSLDSGIDSMGTSPASVSDFTFEFDEGTRNDQARSSKSAVEEKTCSKEIIIIESGESCSNFSTASEQEERQPGQVSGSKFEDNCDGVVFIGEIVDLTDEYRSTRKFSRDFYDLTRA